MPIIEYKGNLFNSAAQTLVNTVNCEGVMGKGIALEFRRRYPSMFAAYKKVCEARELAPGQILPYRQAVPWILNFAVKKSWKQPSRMEWVDSCLARFAAHYRQLGITSVAFPWIGALNGRLPWHQVHARMRSYLDGIDDISIEIVEFDPEATDPLYERLRACVNEMNIERFAKASAITKHAAGLIYDAILANGISSIAKLGEQPGVGDTTIERLYLTFRAEPTSSSSK